MADEEMSDAPAAEQTDQSEQTQQAGQTQQERRYANPGETLYGEQPQQGGKPQQEEIDWDSMCKISEEYNCTSQQTPHRVRGSPSSLWVILSLLTLYRYQRSY